MITKEARPPSLLTVLVVEDNEDGADSLSLFLRLCGYDVQVAYDGPTALQEANLSPPEVVLLDIGLPGMDGWQVARRLREQLQSRPFLVALTAHGTADDFRRSEEAGLDLHLVKPVDPHMLRNVLEGFERQLGE